MKIIPLLASLAAIVLSLETVNVSGQETSKKETLAGQLVDLLDMQKTFDSTLDSIPTIQLQMLAKQNKSPEEQAIFKRIMQRSMQAVKQEVNWDTVRPIFVKMYADSFTEDQLNSIVAYYNSPVGKEWIQKQPAIQAETVLAMGQIIPMVQAAMVKATKQAEETAFAKATFSR